MHSVTAALALCLSFAASAGQPDDDRASIRISAIRDIAEAAYGGSEPGAAILVMEDGETLLADGFGMADLEWSVPATVDTAFRIGSISKPFTAIAVLRLVEAGRVDLDRPIAAYLPELPAGLGRPTVRQLLSHTSGLPDHFALPVIPSIMRNPIAPEAIVELMDDAEPEFEPGTRWSYSNFNYVLLGRLIEAMDEQGRDYGTYIEEEIFAPLNMRDSHYDRQSAVIARRARGYDHDGAGPVNTLTAETSLAYAAGALMSSAEDMARFTNAIRDDRLLGADMRSRAWTPTAFADGGEAPYGLGFNVSEFLGERAIWHSGSINGFQATWIHLPESDRTVAIMSNGYYRPNTTTTARRLLAELAGMPVPDFAPVEVGDETLVAAEGRYQLDDGRIFQIHVQDGIRFNIDGGPWRELAYSGGDIFYRPDTLSHLRLDLADGAVPASLAYLSPTLEPSVGQRIEGAVEGADVAIPLDRNEADRLAGDWRVASGDIFTLAHQRDRLILRLPGQPGYRLHRRSEGRYFVREAPITIAFSEDGARAEISLYGTMMELRRE